MKQIIIACIVCLTLFVTIYFGLPEQKVEDIKESPPQKITVLQKEKSGPKAAKVSEKGKRITVHFELFLAEGIDKGKKVESTRDSNQPYEFLLGSGQVFPGWDNAIRYMKKGDRNTIFIPASEGYGAEGLGSKIPPDSSLVLDVEILEVK